MHSIAAWERDATATFGNIVLPPPRAGRLACRDTRSAREPEHRSLHLEVAGARDDERRTVRQYQGADREEGAMVVERVRRCDVRSHARVPEVDPVADEAEICDGRGAEQSPHRAVMLVAEDGGHNQQKRDG